MKYRTLHGYFDLRYVEANVPFRDSKYGPVIDLDPAILERRIAEELILQRFPIRGREICFLRKQFDMSLEKFANSIGYTASGVLKWERDPDKRLDPVVEVAMRSYFAEKLGIKISGWFRELIGTEEIPLRLEVRIDRAA